MFNAPTITYKRDNQLASLGGLNGSASIQEKNLVLSVVNPSVSDSRETQIVVCGAASRSGITTTLTHSDLHAHNTFERNDVVIPRAEAVQPSEDQSFCNVQNGVCNGATLARIIIWIAGRNQNHLPHLRISSLLGSQNEVSQNKYPQNELHEPRRPDCLGDGLKAFAIIKRFAEHNCDCSLSPAGRSFLVKRRSGAETEDLGSMRGLPTGVT